MSGMDFEDYLFSGSFYESDCVWAAFGHVGLYVVLIE